MTLFESNETTSLLLYLTGLLIVVTAIIVVARQILKSESSQSLITILTKKIKIWWEIYLIFFIALLFGKTFFLFVFAFISLLALREFITLTETKKEDHRTIFWAFFVILPLQYYFVSQNWYNLFTLFIPVYVFIFISVRISLANNHRQFLTRIAKIQWGLMVSVYFISHASALLNLGIDYHKIVNLLLILIFVVEMSDFAQHLFGKLFGKRQIISDIDANKTFEGHLTGLTIAFLIGVLFFWATPFNWWQSGLIFLLIASIGYAGDITMIAIKKDKAVQINALYLDESWAILDRIDSLCFTLPVLYHLITFLSV